MIGVTVRTAKEFSHLASFSPSRPSSEVDCILSHVVKEIEYARARHPPMGTVFDAYTIIREEMEEFFDSIKLNSPDIHELYQVIACCLMALEDVFHVDGKVEFSIHHDYTGKVSDKPTIYQIYASGQYYFDKFWDDVGDDNGSVLVNDLTRMANSIFTGLVLLLHWVRVDEKNREFGSWLPPKWVSDFHSENF